MNDRISKKILFVLRRAPYGSAIARDALDALLAASAYDQQLSLLFMNDGVFQLLKGQVSQEIAQKSFSSILPVLSIYGIDSVYVHQESLTERSILLDEIVIDSVQMIDSSAISNLLAQQDQLLSF